MHVCEHCTYVCTYMCLYGHACVCILARGCVHISLAACMYVYMHIHMSGRVWVVVLGEEIN